MIALPVPLEADEETGALTSDGQPMILIPRRFWVFVQKQAEEQFGLAATEELYDRATRKGARIWCEQEEIRSATSRVDVLTRYFERISARGMGQFSVKSLDTTTAQLTVELRHSIYVAEYGQVSRCVCYSFASAVAGAVEYLVGGADFSSAEVSAKEVCCEANGHSHCSFEAGPKTHSVSFTR